MPADEMVPLNESLESAEVAAKAAEQAAADAADAARRAEKPYFSRGRWTVTRGYGYCYAISDQGALFEYDARLKTVDTTIGDESIRSLKEGDKRHLTISFIDAANKRGFYNRTSDFKALLRNGAVFLKTSYDSDILDFLAKYDFVAFWTDKRVLVRSFSLVDSAEMVANIRECARKESVLHPTDPFSR